MKLKLIVTTAMATILMSSTALAAINLTVDGETLGLDVPPSIVDGRTLVPVRAIFEKLGATVEWNAETNTVTAKSPNTDISLILNSTTAVVNNETKILDVPAQSINGRTMVPARFVAENLNCSVDWDSNTQTVKITTVENKQPDPTQPVLKPIEETNKIYITETGKKYHNDSSCNGGTYTESTLEKALAKGLTPCTKCVQ